jgi:hypothetical protein
VSSYQQAPGVANAASPQGVLGMRAARAGRRVAVETHHDPVAQTVTHVDYTQPVAPGVPMVTARHMDEYTTGVSDG